MSSQFQENITNFITWIFCLLTQNRYLNAELANHSPQIRALAKILITRSLCITSTDAKEAKNQLSKPVNKTTVKLLGKHFKVKKSHILGKPHQARRTRISIPYIKRTVNRIADEDSISTTYKPAKTIMKILPHPKDKIFLKNQGIFKIIYL